MIGKDCYIICVLIISMAFLPSVDGYYMEYLGFIWEGPPLVCVWDSDYNRHAIEAINIWQNTLFDNFGPGYNFLGTIITPESPWEVIELCRILVVYVEIEYATVEELDGMTGVMRATMGTNYVVAYVYEARPQVFPNLKAYDDSVIRTTMHEMGHAFGLGHVIAESAGEAMKPWPQTLMWKASTALKENKIDQATLDGFQNLYKSGKWSENVVLYPNYHFKVEFPDRLINPNGLSISFS